MFSQPIAIRGALAWSAGRWTQLGPTFLEAGVLEQLSSEAQRQKKMMSHSAWLFSRALGNLLKLVDWKENRESIGCYLGVGASGSTPSQVDDILRSSLCEQGEFSMDRFGTAGLAACNPLFAFQLMNNFTLCHGSILEHLQGPNSAMYSRGVGTVSALAEACFAIDERLVDRAIAGGADTAFHPVTGRELELSGMIEAGLKPAEGAAVLALGRESRSEGVPEGAKDSMPLGWIERVGFYGGAGQGEFSSMLERASSELGLATNDPVFIAPWGTPPRKILEARLSSQIVQNWSTEHGESLAAAPAVAWVLSLEAMREKKLKMAWVLSAGPDGGLGAVQLRGSLDAR